MGIGVCTGTGVVVNLVLLVLCANRHGAVGAVVAVVVVLQWCSGAEGKESRKNLAQI
jgi:hypothetical protein